MGANTPDWPYWWAVADTHVKLSQCIALSLNINPGLIDFRPGMLGKTGLWSLDPSSVRLFKARYSILTQYRINGAFFSADTPGGRERSVLLREFARFASQKFSKPPIPDELAVLAALGDRPLAAPEIVADMVTAGRFHSPSCDPGEKAANAPPSVVKKTSSESRRLTTKEQRVYILQRIAERGFDPQKLPISNDSSGVKKQVWGDFARLRLSETQYKKRWQELRDSGEISDQPLEGKVG